VFLTIRSDGVAAVGYTNANAIVDEVRIGRSHEMHATTVWLRDDNGGWSATSTSTPTPLIDTMRIGKDNMRRLQSIAGFVVAPVSDKTNQ
jgi:hypothetical protein